MNIITDDRRPTRGRAMAPEDHSRFDVAQAGLWSCQLPPTSKTPQARPHDVLPRCLLPVGQVL